MSPSGSVAVATQVRVSEVVTPLLGVMETEVTVGAVLSTTTKSVSVSVSPSSSVAVASQVTVSPGSAHDASRSRVVFVLTSPPSPSVQR